MPRFTFLILCFLIFCGWGCKRTGSDKTFLVPLKMLSDAAYPDNPDIGFRSAQYNQIRYDAVSLTRQEDFLFDISLSDSTDITHTITLRNVNLYEFIPSTPEWVKVDNYLTRIGIINQEWNRFQVQFPKDFKGLELRGKPFENQHFSRVDVARNCLNAYLWEVIAFVKEGDKEMPYYHGWFTFPPDLYEDLFEKKNNLSYDSFRDGLENWTDPPNEFVDLSVLREEISSKPLSFESLNEEFYPLKGEREKKNRNILYPKNCVKISDFLTDSSRFATFCREGLYDTSDPRKTRLGRLAKLQSVSMRSTTNPVVTKDTLTELELRFTGKDNSSTKFILGGLSLPDLPHLDTADLHKGWQMPMGIANHSFYETYQHSLENPQMQSNYFGILTNGQNEWLDSHQIGIDGPLLFLDKSDPGKLHVLLLAFERHAFVGHYVVQL